MSACVPFTYNEQHQQNLQQQQQLPLQENCFLVQIESSLGAPPITSCRSTSPIPSVSSLEILFEQSSSSTLVPSSRKPLKKKRSSFFQLLGTAKKQPAKDTTDGAVVLKSTIEEHLSVTEKSVDKSTMTDPVKEFPLSDCNYPHHIDGTSSALITPRANTATSSDFLACIVSALSPYDNPHHHRRRASVLKLESVMSLASEFIQGDSNNSASTTTNTPLFSSVEDCEYSSGSETNWEEEYTVCKHVKQQLHHRKTSDLSSIYSVTSINSSTSAYSISSYINPYNCVSEGTITHSVRSDMDLNQYYFKDEDEVQVAEIAPSTRDNASFVSSKRERIAVYSPLIENPSSGVTRQPTVQMKPVLRPRRSFLKLFK